MTPERKQELFTHVAKHLLAQGQQAVDEEGNCKYRLQNGERMLSCSVGCLIPDEHYNPEMEGCLISIVDSLPPDHGRYKVARAVLEGSGINVQDREEIQFLGELQSMHDSPGNWDKAGFRIKRLISFAVVHDLSTAAVL